jgi:hypothetical protein
MERMFDAAAACLAPNDQRSFQLALLAERILRRAASGQCDPRRLLPAALMKEADASDAPL